MATPIVQYGCRDDDDDSDDGRRHSRHLKKLCKIKKIKSVISDTKTLLKGASFQGSFHLYGLEDDDEEDSSSSYESESSDDGGSVCSKASVASKTAQSLKKLGSSFRGVVTVGKRQPSDHQGGDQDDDDVSVASRASEAVKKVKGTLSKALGVGGRRAREYDDDDSDSSLSSEEEDLLLEEAPKPRKKFSLRRSKSTGGEAAARFSIRRSKSTGGRNVPRNLNFRHSTGQQHQMPARNMLGDDLFDLDRSQEEEEDPRHKSFAFENNWSMNITQDMLDEANAEEGGKAWDMNVPKNLLPALANKHCTKAA